MGSSSSTQQTQSHTNTKSDVQQAERSSRQAFTSDKMKNAYDNMLGAAENNYSGMSDLLNNLTTNYYKNNSLSDPTYFNQGWNKSYNLNNDNMDYLNTRDLDPTKDKITNDYIKASEDAAWLGYGSAWDQANQNVISAGMPNSSSHQTALAKVGAQLASNLNKQRQETYLNQRNSMENTAMQANKQLGDFYNTLTNIGLDRMKLSDQDLQTMFNAYNSMNDVMNTWGKAVEMGADPTVITEGRQVGESTQDTNATTTTKQSNGLGSILGTVLGVMPWGNLFGGKSS